MVDDNSAADETEDEPEAEEKEKIQLSLAQVAASSAAAVSAAVICSLFGVAGTVIGTAIASVVATIGSALYAHSLRRTKARLRRLHQAGAASPPLTEVLKTSRQQGRDWLRQVPWRLVGLGTAAVFVFSIGVVTVVELAAGQTLSHLFHVSNSGDGSTSIGHELGGGGHKKHQTKPTPTPTPTLSTTPTPSPTVTVTVTSAPTPSTSPTTATPSPSGILPSLPGLTSSSASSSTSPKAKK